MAKTNKSYSKRLRVTKKGKIVGRSVGQNHYNAKTSGATRMGKRRGKSIVMTAATRGRFLPGS